MGRISAIIFSIAAFVISLDQYTKNLILELLSHEGQSRPFLPWFNFTLVYNPGAAFGIMRNLPDPFRSWFFYLLPIAVLCALWFLFVRKLDPKELLAPVAMGLVFGGAIGNLIDRIRFGYVVDFIDWSYPSGSSCLPLFYHFTQERCHWPKFNIADAAISVAAVLLVFHSFKKEQEEKLASNKR